MRTRLLGPRTFLPLALAIAASAAPARAALITFDFNSSAIDNRTAKDAYQTSGSGYDRLDKYVTDLWGSKVNVLGGAKATDDPPENLNQYYLGNTEHFTGRGGSNHPPTSGDGYLYNLWNSGEDRITMVFEKGVYGFQVDWQVFPVTKSSTDKADFKILATGANGTQQLFYASLEAPGNPMREQGLLGVFSSAGFVAPAGGWTTLEFVDWNSAPVGIDNLILDPGPPVIPEPGTVVLLGSGLLSLALLARRRAA